MHLLLELREYYKPLLDGEKIIYDSIGNISVKEYYSESIKDSVWFYYKNNQLIKEIYWQNGVLTDSILYDVQDVIPE